MIFRALLEEYSTPDAGATAGNIDYDVRTGVDQPTVEVDKLAPESIPPMQIIDDAKEPPMESDQEGRVDRVEQPIDEDLIAPEGQEAPGWSSPTLPSTPGEHEVGGIFRDNSNGEDSSNPESDNRDSRPTSELCSYNEWYFLYTIILAMVISMVTDTLLS